MRNGVMLGRGWEGTLSDEGEARAKTAPQTGTKY